jgi:hypothetical protein
MSWRGPWNQRIPNWPRTWFLIATHFQFQVILSAYQATSKNQKEVLNRFQEGKMISF